MDPIAVVVFPLSKDGTVYLMEKIPAHFVFYNVGPLFSGWPGINQSRLLAGRNERRD